MSSGFTRFQDDVSYEEKQHLSIDSSLKVTHLKNSYLPHQFALVNILLNPKSVNYSSLQSSGPIMGLLLDALHIVIVWPTSSGFTRLQNDVFYEEK